MRAREETALERLWSDRVRAWPTALFAWAGAFALYAATLGRHVYTFDPAQFQTMARTGGIAHSGYPTLVLLLQGFGLLPFGTLAWRANLLSALAGATAVAWLAFLAHRWTRSPLAALTAAAVFAIGISMWKESTLAGVHAPTLALGATLFVLALRFAHEPGVWLAAAGGFLFGVGVTCHLTVLATGLPLLLAFASRVRRLARLKLAIAAAALGLVAGLTPFAYTLAHDRPEQPMNYLHDTLEPGEASFAVERPDLGQRVERLGWLLSGRQYLGADRRDAGVMARRAAHLAIVLSLNELPFAAMLLALAGLVLMARAPGWPRRLAFTWLAGTLLLVGIGGTELTLRFFFLPGTWLLALGVAVALAAILQRSRAWGAIAVALALASPLLRHAVAETPAPLDRFAMGRHLWQLSPAVWDPFHESLSYDAYGRGVLARLPEDAVVLAGLWNEATTLRYFTMGEGLRPDVQVLLAGRRDPRLSRLWHEAIAHGRPAYLTQEPVPGALPHARVELVWDSGWNRLWRAVPAAE